MAKIGGAGGGTPLDKYAEEVSIRDVVWDATVKVAVENPDGFRRSDVRDKAGLTRVQDRSITYTLNAMENLGWLERKPENDKKWYPGQRCEEFF